MSTQYTETNDGLSAQQTSEAPQPSDAQNASEAPQPSDAQNASEAPQPEGAQNVSEAPPAGETAAAAAVATQRAESAQAASPAQNQLSSSSRDMLRQEVAKARPRSKKFDLVLTLLTLAIVAGLLALSYRSGAILGNRNVDLDVQASVEGYVVYNTEKYVIATQYRLETDRTSMASILTAPENSSQKKAALILSGIATPGEMRAVLDLLKEYNAPAIFFMDGVTLAENQDVADDILHAGYQLGTSGFDDSKNHHQLKEGELAVSLAKSRAVFEPVAPDATMLYYGVATEYTDQVLHEAACAGLNTAVLPTIYANDSSFPTFSAAMGFMGRLGQCELICFKLSGVLDEIEFEPYEVDERPAWDKQFTADAEVHADDYDSKVVQNLTYLLEALEAVQIPLVPLDRLNMDPDPTLMSIATIGAPELPCVVPESDPVDPSALDGALMIGDSLTKGLGVYHTDLTGHVTFCAYKSISPDQIVNNVSVEKDDGESVAVLDEIRAQQPTSIYIMLGMNVLASGRDNTFIAYYDRLIDTLQKTFPDIPIYMQSITPVTTAAATNNVLLTNRRIRKANLQLAELAEKKGCHYLDVYSALQNEDLALIPDLAQSDGIHMKLEGCQRWAAYLLSHVAR